MNLSLPFTYKDYSFCDFENISFNHLCDFINKTTTTTYFKLTPEILEKQLTSVGFSKTISVGVFKLDNLVGVATICTDENTAYLPYFEAEDEDILSLLINIIKENLLANSINKLVAYTFDEQAKLKDKLISCNFHNYRSLIFLNGEPVVPGSCTLVKKENLTATFLEKTASLALTTPAFEYSFNNLIKNNDNYQVCYTAFGEDITSFCVYIKNSGTIVYTGRKAECFEHLIAIIMFLGHKFENVDTFGIDTADNLLISTLKEMGLEEFALQNEFVLNI